ncbi:hypothetical protein [Microbacterium aurantiacum]|uniref:Uncharacterized protein n=1 Tax=Microbacterium aurantiacum TaxID=162393 RepID=A0A0M8MGL9_9MICO|nr:hypothetical protein [Microbacterium chocolatum]KOS09687.1 hypothetical protein XI38_14555 [Microbacterium chocolatum]
MHTQTDSLTPSVTDAGVLLTSAAGSLNWSTPIIIDTIDGHTVRTGYDTFDTDDNGELTATARVELGEGTTLHITDQLRSDGVGVLIHRIVRVERAGTTTGVRVGFEARTTVDGASDEDWEYFIPSTMYNRNDTDGDGREDYLGTYEQEHRDDKNGILAMLARHGSSGATFSVARLTLPQYDNGVTPEQLVARSFVQQTDIGSLGLAPHSGQTSLRGAYPFTEAHSFCLDTDGTGWGAFTPVAVGTLIDITYEVRVTNSEDLTTAIWDLVQHQRSRLETKRPDPGVSLEAAIEHRQLLTQLYYRKWTAEENAKEPAGYLVHFSPRVGKTAGSLLEFGFSGDQALLAYAQLRWSQRTGVRLYADRARSVLDFFVTHCQLDNGFCQGIFDPINDEFTYWFTGILMPFQYAENEEDVRRYVGEQIAGALMPIARELRGIEGNYLRTMCESIYPLILAYQADDQPNPAWLHAAEKFGNFLLNTQAEDGSWYRAYAPDGAGLTSPAAWFGASDKELKSGTIFPVPILVELHRITGDERYLDAARKAATFMTEQYVEPVDYIGGLNDTTHIKSVKGDAVGVMFLMRSLLKLYEATADRAHLDAAVKAAKVLCSWVYLWDVPFPEDTLLGRAGFRSTGWAGCDVIASGTYLDNEFLEFTGDLANIAAHAGDAALLDFAELVQYGMQMALSTPENDHGYVAPGIQCEGILTSYWLSRPDTTEFSGAVNKVKGDDNDTCNALTNGQAAYGLYDLLDSFGTADFAAIKADRFQ